MNIRSIVVDDEPLAIGKLVDYINRVPYLQLLGTFDNAIDAMEFIRGNKVDLMFLDIQMDKLTGIQLLEILRDKPKIVITSAYDNYAVKGYELDVSDYLLKPISFERFLKAVTKINLEMEPPPTATITVQEQPHPLPQDDFIFVKADYHMHKIRLSEVLFIEGMKDYLRIHTEHERIMTLMSFLKIEKVLPPSGFIRVHKSFIVPLNKIEKIERNAIIIGDKRIPIGNKYRKMFLELIAGEKIL